MDPASGEILDRFFRALDAASWPEPIWHALIGYCTARGIDRVIYHHMPPLGGPDDGKIRVIAHGYPEDWLHGYIRNKSFRRDPLAAEAISSTDPFPWSEIRRRRRLTAAEEAVLRQFAEVGMTDGIALSAFGPGGRNGYFGLSLGARAEAPDPASLRELHWVCQAAHLVYCKMLLKSLPAAPDLSEREREILRWVAHGKSNGVIAEIMGLSPHTVDAHLRRIFLKLGTRDRISAVVKGLGTGLIRGH